MKLAWHVSESKKIGTISNLSLFKRNITSLLVTFFCEYRNVDILRSLVEINPTGGHHFSLNNDMGSCLGMYSCTLEGTYSLGGFLRYEQMPAFLAAFDLEELIEFQNAAFTTQVTLRVGVIKVST